MTLYIYTKLKVDVLFGNVHEVLNLIERVQAANLRSKFKIS